MLASEVIQQLEECNSHSMGFPTFDVFFPIIERLSAYRSKSEWALIIETLVFNPGPASHQCCETLIYCYGSNLPGPIGIQDNYLNVTSDGPGGPLFDPEDILGHLISPRAVDMAIRGRVVNITTDTYEYESAGIKLARPPTIQGQELLRLTAPAYRRLFLATAQEMADFIGENMPLLLCLEEWLHPNPDDGESPSSSESFQMIAECIAANDPDLYRPSVLPNTHWRNWPMAGAGFW